MASVLAGSAFGDGFGANPEGLRLPPATDAVESWWRAVALGGAGYYARARTELARTRRLALSGSTVPLATPAVLAPESVLSLSLSTEASWLRQLGWHRRASGFDGAALARVPRDPDAAGRSDALCDALIGLAADALGQGRLAVGERLLDRCREVLADPNEQVPSPRIGIRLAWVSAELAMAGGHAERAQPAADVAVVLSAGAESVRHRVKSGLLSAAARCARGDVDAARVAADTVREQCRRHGLLPLEWAAGMLLAAVVDEAEAVCVSVDVGACAAELARRGGSLREV